MKHFFTLAATATLVLFASTALAQRGGGGACAAAGGAAGTTGTVSSIGGVTLMTTGTTGAAAYQQSLERQLRQAYMQQQMYAQQQEYQRQQDAIAKDVAAKKEARIARVKQRREAELARRAAGKSGSAAQFLPDKVATVGDANDLATTSKASSLRAAAAAR